MSCMIIDDGKGGVLKKVGYACVASSDGVRYMQIGDLNKFTQVSRSRSLRVARVAIKKLAVEAYASE